MNIDLDEKEVRVLVQAMWLYNNRLLEIEKELAPEKKSESIIQGDSSVLPANGVPILCCCVDSDKKKPAPPFYNDYSYCENLRKMLKQQQMIFPAEGHEKDKGYDYVSDAVLNEKFGYNMQREQAKWVRCVSGHKHIG